MDFGKFDRLVTINQNSPVKQNNGEATDSWSQLTQIWAQRKEVSGRERILNGVEENQKRVIYFCHYDSTITARLQLVDGSDVYDIENVREIGRGEGLELTCLRKTG